MTLAISRVESRSWVDLMAPAVELAKSIAGTEFVPRALRDKPAAIVAAILYGDEIGVGPMQSLATIAVIDGKPYVAAQTQRALVLASGHDLWLDESTNARATWAGRRAGSENVTRITWTMDDARRAHLDGKPNWRSYPRAMLSARASAELARATFADVVAGLAAIEERDDFDPALVGLAGAIPGPAGTSGPAPAGRRSRAPRRPAPAPESPPLVAAPAAAPTRSVPPLAPPAKPGASRGPAPLEVDHEPLDPREVDQPPMTGGQRRRMMALFRQREISERRDRLRVSAEWIGRPIASAAELTSAEADRIIDVLEGLGEPPDDGSEPPGEAPPVGELSEVERRPSISTPEGWRALGERAAQAALDVDEVDP